ncbi:uncharacterized protein METZ01_LOCUS230337, partial [marine metagenome]
HRRLLPRPTDLLRRSDRVGSGHQRPQHHHVDLHGRRIRRLGYRNRYRLQRRRNQRPVHGVVSVVVPPHPGDRM